MNRVRLAVLLAVFASLTHANAARADDAEARQKAAESYRGAQSAFARKDYAAAAAAFEAAAGFVPHPAALLAGADAWERAGEPVRAVEACDRALVLPNVKAAGEKDGVDYARDARECVTRNASKVATLDVTGPSTSAVRIDGGAQEIPPFKRRARPGKHTIKIVDLGSSKTWDVDVTVAGGETKRVDASPEPSAAPPPPAPPPRAEPRSESGGGPPTASWVMFGVAGAGAVATGVFTAMLVGSQRSYKDNPTQAGHDEFYRNVVLTDVGIGVTVAAAATGLVIWLAAPHESTRGSAPGVFTF